MIKRKNKILMRLHYIALRYILVALITLSNS